MRLSNNIDISSPTTIIPISPEVAPLTTTGVFVTVGGGVVAPTAQSGEKGESRELEQVGSTWKRNDPTFMAATPLSIQDWTRETRPLAL